MAGAPGNDVLSEGNGPLQSGAVEDLRVKMRARLLQARTRHLHPMQGAVVPTGSPDEAVSSSPETPWGQPALVASP